MQSALADQGHMTIRKAASRGAVALWLRRFVSIFLPNEKTSRELLALRHNDGSEWHLGGEWPRDDFSLPRRGGGLLRRRTVVR